MAASHKLWYWSTGKGKRFDPAASHREATESEIREAKQKLCGKAGRVKKGAFCGGEFGDVDVMSPRSERAESPPRDVGFRSVRVEDHDAMTDFRDSANIRLFQAAKQLEESQESTPKSSSSSSLKHSRKSSQPRRLEKGKEISQDSPSTISIVPSSVSKEERERDAERRRIAAEQASQGVPFNEDQAVMEEVTRMGEEQMSDSPEMPRRAAPIEKGTVTQTASERAPPDNNLIERAETSATAGNSTTVGALKLIPVDLNQPKESNYMRLLENLGYVESVSPLRDDVEGDPIVSVIRSVRLDLLPGGWASEVSETIAEHIVNHKRPWRATELTKELQARLSPEREFGWIYSTVVHSILTFRTFFRVDQILHLDPTKAVKPTIFHKNLLKTVLGASLSVLPKSLEFTPVDPREGTWSMGESEVILDHLFDTPVPWNPAKLADSLVQTIFAVGSKGRVFGLLRHSILSIGKLLQKNQELLYKVEAYKRLSAAQQRQEPLTKEDLEVGSYEIEQELMFTMSVASTNSLLEVETITLE